MPTISFDVTIPQGQRIAAVLGKKMNLRDVDGNPRDATTQEVRQWVITFVRSEVLNYERQVALQQAVVETPLEIP